VRKPGRSDKCIKASVFYEMYEVKIRGGGADASKLDAVLADFQNRISS